MTGYTFNITSPDYWDSAPYIRHSAYSDKTRNKLTITEQKRVIFRYFYLCRLIQCLQSQNTASLTSRFSNRLCKHISNTRQYNIIGKMGRSSTTFAIFTLLLRNDNHQFVFDKIHSENTVKSIKTVTYRVYIFRGRQSSTQSWPQSADTAPNGCIFRVQWFFSVVTVQSRLCRTWSETTTLFFFTWGGSYTGTIF